MKAYRRESYGSVEVLELREIDRPLAEPGELLVRIHAASVNMADLDYLTGHPRIGRLGTGIGQPRNPDLGIDLAGTVEAIGEGVTRFQVGQRVFGDMTEHGYGAFAELVAAPERGFAPMPTTLDFVEAAAVPQAGVMASQALRGKRNIHPDDKVLVNGAGGNIGPYAVQIAVAFGAEVTAVDAPHKLDMLRAIGAEHVVDYTEVDYISQGVAYDWIVDVAAHRSIFESRKALTTNGVYVMVPATMPATFQAFLVGPTISLFGKQRLGMLPWKPFHLPDVAFLTELIESGKLTPVIDRIYEFGELKEALQYQSEGLPVGKIVVKLI